MKKIISVLAFLYLVVFVDNLSATDCECNSFNCGYDVFIYDCSTADPAIFCAVVCPGEQ